VLEGFASRLALLRQRAQHRHPLAQMPSQMRLRTGAVPIPTFIPTLILIALGASLPAAAAEREPLLQRELLLAGGSLRLCSSLSPGACTSGHAVIEGARRAPRYGLPSQRVAEALDPALWRGRETAREAMRALLEDRSDRPVDAASGTDDVDADALRDRFEARCASADGMRACRKGERSPWRLLDDDQQASVLAALESPQFDGVVRRKERASLAQSRSAHGADILRAFVAAARERTDGAAPRIAVVTASAFDPFDPVDFYLDVLREAGAEVEWWPVDAALAAAVFEHRDCAMLPMLRLQRLKLPARERIYPDLVAQQQRACEDTAALAELPQRMHGVFFAGGDQWKLRRTLFDRDDRPNAWLQALRRAAANGDLIIGGTSAGSAVQSGGPMLSNGTVEQAWKRGAIASPPPVPGCRRSDDCIDGIDEDGFTYWPNGGLGLAPGMVVDTHFSERGRELRLLRLLVDTGAPIGIGIDETSALHLRWRDDGAVDIRALGASGGWVFDAARCEAGGLRANAYYIAPGMALRMEAIGPRWLGGANPPLPATPATALSSTDALDGGALRSLAQHMATSADAGLRFRQIRARAINAQVVLTRTAATWSGHDPGTTYASIGPLRIDVAPLPGCVDAVSLR
jgi:cyanophycinase-like exopeptidase